MSSGYKGPAVVFDQVFKAFGAHQVLRNVSFSVPAGEALCILGRSGTGKSVIARWLRESGDASAIGAPEYGRRRPPLTAVAQPANRADG